MRDLFFFENGYAGMLVENYESGFWWMGCNKTHQLIFAHKIDIEHTNRDYPHAMISAPSGGIGSVVLFSRERVEIRDQRFLVALRSLHFLVLNRLGGVQATAKLVNQTLAGSAQLLPYSKTYAIYQAPIKVCNDQQHLLMGWYKLELIEGPAFYQAIQTGPYRKILNLGMRRAPDGSYYGVSHMVPLGAQRSLLWYYVLSCPSPPPSPLRLAHAYYFHSLADELETKSFSLSSTQALWILHIPVKKAPFFALVSEITPEHKKRQVYALHAPGSSVYPTAIELMIPYSPSQPLETYIFIAGYTNQLPSLGKHLLSIACYNSFFEKKWAFAYNLTLLKKSKIFFKTYKQNLYLAGSSVIGVFERSLNPLTGLLDRHRRYPIDWLVVNRSKDRSFYLQHATKEVDQVRLLFKNYAVDLREKLDFGVIPIESKLKAKKGEAGSLLDRSCTLLTHLSSVILVFLFVGVIYKFFFSLKLPTFFSSALRLNFLKGYRRKDGKA